MIFAFLGCAVSNLQAITLPYADQSVPVRYRGGLILNKPKQFTEKVVALTFDDGPDAKTTPSVLHTLKVHGVKATFFLIGQNAKRHPELVLQEAMDGHVVGNHTWSHPAKPSPGVATMQVDRTAKAIFDATGQYPTLFRSPYGIQKSQSNLYARAKGYTSVLWDVVGPDTTKAPDTKTIVASVLSHVHPGDIVLFHDAYGKTYTADALPKIIAGLKANGYACVTVPELLRKWDSHVVAMEEKARLTKVARSGNLHPRKAVGLTSMVRG